MGISRGQLQHLYRSSIFLPKHLLARVVTPLEWIPHRFEPEFTEVPLIGGSKVGNTMMTKCESQPRVNDLSEPAGGTPGAFPKRVCDRRIADLQRRGKDSSLRKESFVISAFHRIRLAADEGRVDKKISATIKGRKLPSLVVGLRRRKPFDKMFRCLPHHFR